MAKTKTNPKPVTTLVSGDVLKQIKACRPLRLFINKQKKKGNEENPLRIRGKFLQLSTEKKVKYFQKAIDKYIDLLDEKEISEKVQIQGQLFENLLTKTEQKIYFESLDAPTKPISTASAVYAEEQKRKKVTNPKPWKTLTADEKKPYTQMVNDAKTEYANQIENFAQNLPERLKVEYLSYVHPSNHDEEPKSSNSTPINQRHQSVAESIKTTNDNYPKLTRSQLDDLHKCKPDILYFEKKYSDDDDKPTFANTLAKNNYIRALFRELSEKKRHKLILKSTKKWQEYLENNHSIVEQQIPTLRLLLSKQDDIYFYFSSLGLPIRPPVSALLLFNSERQDQQNWSDLSQTIKDEYIKRLGKIKNEYHEKFVEFVEKTLPNDYIRLEFFRNVKHAAKDYETFTKDRQVHDLDEGQLKITQYLKPKNQLNQNTNEFNRIKQQLLATNLTNEQKKLVQKLGDLMDKFREETQAESSKPKSSTGASKRKSPATTAAAADDDDIAVVVVNGETSEEAPKKKKKKHKEDEEKSSSKKKEK